MVSFKERAAEMAKASGRDMRVAAVSLPAEGTALGRFVGYVEVGLHHKKWRNEMKERNQVLLTFELSGVDWPAVNGRLPTKSETLTNSDAPNSALTELRKSMDPEERYTHFLQMMEDVFLLDVEHSTSNGRQYANLRKIRPPVVTDPRTRQVTDYSSDAPPMTCQPMAFLWDAPTIETWDGLFIAGTFNDGGSKNTFQNRIRSALNFEGSPIWRLLEEDGADPYEDFDPATQTAVPGSADANRKRAAEMRARGDDVPPGATSEDAAAPSGRGGRLPRGAR